MESIVVKKIHSFRTIACSPLIMILLNGCGFFSSTDMDTQQSNVHIIGGTEVTERDAASRSTVAVIVNKDWVKPDSAVKKTCSGTLIDKRVVLTARHCFEAGPDCQILFGLRVDDPKAKVIDCKSVRSETHDIALAFMSEEAPLNYQPVSYLTSQDSLNVGDEIIHVGYGKTAFDDETTRGILRWTANKEIRIAKIDSNQKTFRNYPGSTCNGDSGGPVFLKKDSNELILAGVLFAGGNYRCNMYDESLDVRAFADWIAKTIENFWNQK